MPWDWSAVAEPPAPPPQPAPAPAPAWDWGKVADPPELTDEEWRHAHPLNAHQQALNAAAPPLRAATDQGQVVGDLQGVLNQGGDLARGVASAAVPLLDDPENARTDYMGRPIPRVTPAQQFANDLSDEVAAEKQARQDSNQLHQGAQTNAETVAGFAPLLLGVPGLATVAGASGGNRRQDILEQGGSAEQADAAGQLEALLMAGVPGLSKIASPLLRGAGTTTRAVARELGASPGVAERAAGAATQGTEQAAVGAGFPAADAAISAGSGDPERAKAELASAPASAEGFGVLGTLLGLLTGRHAATPRVPMRGDPESNPKNPTPEITAPVPDPSATTTPPANQPAAIEKEAANGLSAQAQSQVPDARQGSAPGSAGSPARQEGPAPEGPGHPQAEAGLAGVTPTDVAVPHGTEAPDARPSPAPERAEGGAAPTPEAQAEAAKAGVSIDRSKDVPLVGGISQDGKTVYVDKNAPQKLTMPDGKVADVDASLVKHETAEKPAIDANTAAGHEPVKAYEDAHNNTAVPAEDALLKSKGIEPDHFNDALKPHVEAIADRNRTAMEQGKTPDLPPDLQAEHVAAGAKEGLNPEQQSTVGTADRLTDAAGAKEALPDRSPPAPSSGVAPGERKNLRPDLATPGLDPRQRDAFVAQRNAQGKTEPRSREKVRQEAAVQVRADPDAELQRLLEASANGERGDFNKAAAQYLLDHLYEKGRLEDHAKLSLAYLTDSSEWAREGGMMQDRVATPQGRLAEARIVVAPGRGKDVQEVAALTAERAQHQAERDRLQATIDLLQRQAATHGPTARASATVRRKAAVAGLKDAFARFGKALTEKRDPRDGASFSGGDPELINAAAAIVIAAVKAGIHGFAELALAVADNVRAFRHDPEAHKALEKAWDEAQGKDDTLEAREGGVADAQDADPRHSLETRIEQKQKRLAGLIAYKAKLERELSAMTPEQRITFLEGEAARKEMPPELRKVDEDGQAEIRAIEKRIKALDAKEAKDPEAKAKAEPTAMEKLQQRLKAEEERLATAERTLTKRKADLEGMTRKERAAFLAKEKADGKPPAEIQARRDEAQKRRDAVRKEITKLEAEAGFAKGKARVLKTKEEKEAKKLATIEKRMAEREAKLAALDPAARGAELARERAAGATPTGLQKLRDASAARLKAIRDRVKALEATAEGATTRIPERKLLQGRIDEIRRRTAETKDRYKREIDRLAALSWDERRQEAYLGKAKSPYIQGEVTARQAELKGLREELEAHRKPIRELLARRAKLDELLDRTGEELTAKQREKAITDAGDIAQLKKLGYDVTAKDPAWTHDKREWANFLAAVEATTGGMPAVLRELYIGTLHMSAGVAGKKIAADAINLGLLAVRRPLEVAINAATGNRDKGATLGELGRIYGAMLPALWKALKNGAQTWRTEKTPLELQAADDLQHFAVIRGWKGVVFRNLSLLPMVRAIDAFTRTFIAHTEVAAQAYRSAVDGDGKRLKGDALTDHIAKETGDQTSESWRRAHELAMRSTFTEKPGEVIGTINRMKYGKPKTAGGMAVKAGANVLFPFTTIPSNIIKQGFTHWTPLLSDALAVGRAMSKDETGALRIDPEKATEEAAQALIRWGVTGGALWMASQGIISGSEADDKNKRSFHLWGLHWGYQHLGPITTALSTAADLVRGAREGGAAGALSESLLGELHRLGEAPLAKPLMDIIAAASSRDPDRWLHYAIDRLPIPSVVRQGAGASDDSVSNPGAPAVGDGRPERFMEYLKRAVGLSKTPDRMVEGVPQSREHFDSRAATFLYRLFSPMPLGREDSPEAQFKREKDASGKVLTEFNHLRSKAKESGSDADAEAVSRFAEEHQAEMDHANEMRGAEHDIKGSIRDGKRGDPGSRDAIRQRAIEALKANRAKAK